MDYLSARFDVENIARSAMVDPDWPKKALSGEIPGKCIHCKVCQWRINPEKCAGRIFMRRKAQEKESAL